MITTSCLLALAMLVAKAPSTTGKADKSNRGRANESRSSGGSDSSADSASRKRTPDGEETATSTDDDSPSDSSSGSSSGSKKSGDKVKVYEFSGLDVEGKLKTPQLLYFLNRVKLELEPSAPDKRSFMKDLERSADDKSL